MQNEPIVFFKEGRYTYMKMTFRWYGQDDPVTLEKISVLFRRFMMLSPAAYGVRKVSIKSAQMPRHTISPLRLWKVSPFQRT